jgi:hypothetical protein
VTAFIRRREFITLLSGAAAAWPLVARAQQPAKPLVGVLSIGSPESNAMQLASFRNGLSEQGYAEGQNAVIESRFAETGQYDRLVSLASDLARLPVTVLVADWNCGRRPSCQGRHYDNPDRICERERPGQGRPGREHESARRQCYRRKLLYQHLGSQAP